MSDLEARLRSVLTDPSWSLPAPPDPAAWATGRSRRRRWRTLAAALSTAVVAGAGALTVPALVQPADNGPAGTTWERLPDAPVTPRQGAVAAWTGREAVFLGGETGDPTPPGAEGQEPPERARDGAAYDPATGTWRRTAPAPFDLVPYGRTAVLGDVVHALTAAEQHLAYDASEDTWAVLPAPPRAAAGPWTLQSVDGRLLAVRAEQGGPADVPDQVYDSGAGRWTALPTDPIGPTVGRALTATPEGWLLTGFPADIDSPRVLHAALLDVQSGTWRRLPDAVGGGHVRTWTGKRFVSVDTNLDGDESAVDGVTYPRGVALDVAAGTWSRLANAPEEYQQGWGLEAVAGGRIVTGGYRYDDDHAEWTLLRRPDGAAPQGVAAVWAGSTLIALGGFDPRGGYTAAGLSNRAFALREGGEPVVAGSRSCPPAQHCPAAVAPDVRFAVVLDGRPVRSGDRAVPVPAGQRVSLVVTATAVAGTELARLVVGEADDSWGIGPDGPIGLDRVLVEATDLDSSEVTRRLTWAPQGVAGDERHLVAVFALEDGRGASVGVNLASVRIQPPAGS
jgi:hypothetical protein